MRVILSFIILFLITEIGYSGGPWTSGKNHGYFQIGYNTIGTTNEFFVSGSNSIFFNRPVSDNTISAYFEYGISEKFDILGSFPMKFVSTGKLVEDPLILPVLTSGSLNGLGNIELATKYKFYNLGTFVASAELAISLPTAKYDFETGLRTGYQTTGIQSSLFGGFSKKKYYSYVKLAYNLRDKVRDEFKVSTEIGYKVFKDIYIILDFDLLLATGSPQESLVPIIEQTGLYVDGQEYSAITIKASSKLYKKVGINIYSTLANFHGNYVQKASSIGSSIFYKF